MKKVALVFVMAVFVPSLALAWMAMRSLRDQQFAIERQQTLLYQDVADGLAKSAEKFLSDCERDFVAKVDGLPASQKGLSAAQHFDEWLRTNWPMAQVGFVVTMDGKLLCPSPFGGADERLFYNDNAKFLCSLETAEIYFNTDKGGPIANFNNANSVATQSPNNSAQVNAAQTAEANIITANNATPKMPAQQQQIRSVQPQQKGDQPAQYLSKAPMVVQASKFSSSEAEFRQLIGDASDGTLARFLDNKLTVLTWRRATDATNLVYGAQLSLAEVKSNLQGVLETLSPALRDDIAVAVLDDTAHPAALSHPGFQAAWKHPFVATEIGEELPHWEVAVYRLDPAKVAQSAHLLELVFGLLIALLVLSISVGGWLIFRDLERQLTLARQKTDFVSNVSHELKTPLTSIRMFAELLAEERVSDPAKRSSYLNIISAEASRLTRLINNVLDFSRMERGAKKYQFQPLDLAAVLRETADACRPHLESQGFSFVCEGLGEPAEIRGDRDALAQVAVNLISNAEKYSGGGREITLRLERAEGGVEVSVIDRGPGVPRGCEEKIFEQFYRAHDSLTSGIQGSGLGLTLARQIARAHGGDLVYERREGGGSCFTFRLPKSPASGEQSQA